MSRAFTFKPEMIAFSNLFHFNWKFELAPVVTGGFRNSH